MVFFVTLSSSVLAAEEVIQERAEINQPVQWVHKISLENAREDVLVDIPRGAANVRVTNVDDGVRSEVAQNKLARDGARLTINENVKEAIVTYTTEAPTVREEEVNDYTKRVTISSDVHYTDIYSYTTIPETQRDQISLYRVTDGVREKTEIQRYVDTNNNGFIDRIEWITPQLSTETFEIVIVKATHLDENKEFISDIYGEVLALDNEWSEEIYGDEFVRITFEKELHAGNDITLFVRNTQELDTKIEVYYYNSSEKITEFPIIEGLGYYRVLLNGLEGTHDTFDLKIVNSDEENAYLEFDHIIDPTEYLIPYNGVLTTTGTTNDGTFAVSKISNDCDEGTCNNTNAWRAGFDDANPANTQIDWYFNLASLGIRGSDIEYAFMSGGGCWAGGFSASDCDGSDDAEFAAGTAPQLQMFIYNWNTSSWESFGDGYTITDGGNPGIGMGANYSSYMELKESGFSNNLMNEDGKVIIRYNITKATMGATYDVVGIYDYAQLSIQHTSPGTPRSCNYHGSASSSGVFCNANNGANEDATDATYDSCTDGIWAGSPDAVENIYLNTTSVVTGNSIEATCELNCYDSGNEYGIFYNSGSGWANKAYGNCNGAGLENKSVNISIPFTPGKHSVRCWISYSGCDSSNSCCASSFADNDDLNFTVTATQCGTIDKYTMLTENITTSGNCFSIGADNVTLNCNGHSITYGTAGSGGYGVYNNGYDNVIVKYCDIKEGTAGSSQTGIYFTGGADDGTIFENKITTIGGGSYGIRASSGSDRTLIDSNTISTSGSTSYGLAVTSSDNSTIIRNDIGTSGTSSHGLSFHAGSTGNRAEGNTIQTQGSSARGVSLYSGSENLIVYNEITTEGSGAIGVRLSTNSDGNYIVGNDIASSNGLEIDDLGSSVDNYLVYANSKGIIYWTDQNFIDNLDVNVTNDQGIGIGKNLFIGENIVAINTSAFGPNPGINSSANITMYGLNYTLVDEIVKYKEYTNESGTVLASGTDCKGGSCEELSYNIWYDGSKELVFSTTSLGSFAIDGSIYQQTCNLNGSAGATGVFCNANNSANEDWTDGTHDSCTDGNMAGSPDGILDIKVENLDDPTGEINVGENLSLSCDGYCHYIGDGLNYTYMIQYLKLPSGNWTMLSMVPCSRYRNETKKTTSFVFDPMISGTHYLRCYTNRRSEACYNMTLDDGMCCNSSYADHDDLAFEVYE